LASSLSKKKTKNNREDTKTTKPRKTSFHMHPFDGSQS
jgi:hypothetical protein